MLNKENARPLLEQEAGQMETATGKAHNSYNDCSTSQNQNQVIFDLLPQGEANAVSSKELAQMVGAASVRELQHRVAAERGAGALILSTCKGGYFRPQDGEVGQAEISHFVATLRSRALNTLKALRAAKEALSKAEGQITLDELEGL